MGRMAEIWKTTDRGPTTPLSIPDAILKLDPPPVSEMMDDDDVPFIEVGGPSPVMKHLEPIAPKSTPAPIRNELATRHIESPSATPTVKAIMTVRFEPVHAACIAGRSFGADFVAFHQPDHAVSVQYRSLVAEIGAQLPGTKPRALLLVSARPGVGGTTVTLNLGITIARQDGVRVTIVDANGEHPDLSGRIGLGPMPGLCAVAARRMPLGWCLQETVQPNLWALPMGRDGSPSTAEIVPIVEQLRERSDWIVIDSGPWHDGQKPMAEACDGVYLVHSDGDAAAKEMIAAISDATGRLRGCIVTKR
jgi:hypothetical protein